MFRQDQDDAGIVTLTMDDPNAPVNTMNKTFQDGIHATVERLENEISGGSETSIKGITVASAKKTFFASGDIKQMPKATEDDAADMFDMVEDTKASLRRLKKLPVPIAVAINGAALSGSLEVTLGTSHRIAADAHGFKIGLPEVTPDLLPGGGGVSRVVRMLGIQDALTKVILTGAQMNPAKALAAGLADEVVAPEQLIDAARAWLTNENAKATQPQDEKGFKILGDDPKAPRFAMNPPFLPANLTKQLKGSPMKALRLVMQATVEGSQVNIGTALRIESRYFTELATGIQSKNIMQAFFFDFGHAQGGGSRPLQADGISYPKHELKKVAVAGAGMMGAGIAYVCAKVGMEVILKDISLENAERGKSYPEGLKARTLRHGRTTKEKSAVLLNRIKPTESYDDLADVNLVIEVVFKNTDLKHKVHAEIEAAVPETCTLGSNTSTLPIIELVSHVKREKDFIGLHFFSSVDKMQLIEIISGDNIDPAILVASLDFAIATRKTPIVVTDFRGFYTSRVTDTVTNETLRTAAEGYDPAIIEAVGRQVGCPVLQFQLADELNLRLIEKIAGEIHTAAEAAGQTSDEGGASTLVEVMLYKFERPGKLGGKGLYKYVNGKRSGLWPDLLNEFREELNITPIALEDTDLQGLVDYMLFIETIEIQKCVDEGVLLHDTDGSIGSIFGIGYSARTGGTRQSIKNYDGATAVDPAAAHPECRGVAGFVERAEELAVKHGERFGTPESLERWGSFRLG